MKSRSGLLTLGALLAFLPVTAEARPLHHRHHASVRDVPAPAAARNAAVDRFSARMSRLDALMGTERTARTRSANALAY